MAERIILAALLWLCSTAVVVAAPPELQTSDMQEAFFTLRYDRVVNTTIIALYDGDSVYLPLMHLLSLTKVNYEYNGEQRRLTGTFSREMLPYDIDAGTLRAVCGGTTVHLDSGALITDELEWYLQPHAIQKIFGIRCEVAFSDLRVVLRSEKKLPVLLEYERDQQQNSLLHTGLHQTAELGPLIAPPNRSLFNGGALEYSLSADLSNDLSTGRQRGYYSYGLVSGLQILGGDIAVNTGGSYDAQNRRHVLRSMFQWRYVPDDNEFLRQIRIGNLGSRGLTAASFDGITLSNERLERDRLFSVLTIDDYTHPLWEVELYRGGELINVAVADSGGRYTFTLPLHYGQSTYELRFYGPTGEEESELYTVHVPMNFLEPGEVNYTVSAGREAQHHGLLLQGAVAVGITDWLTNRTGVDYVRRPESQVPLVYNTLSARIGSNYIISLNTAPSALYGGSLGAFYGGGFGFNVDYTRFEQNPAVSRRGLYESIETDLYLPSMGLPFGLSLRAGRDRYDSYYRYSARSSLSFALLGLRSMLTYNGTMRTDFSGVSSGLAHSATGNFSFRFSRLPSILGLVLSDVTMRYSTTYDLTASRFTSASAGLTRRLFTGGTLNVSFNKNFLTGRSGLSAGLNMLWPFLRSSSSVQMNQTMNTYSQNIRGTVAFDSESGQFMFSSRGLVGSGMAKLRLFADYNGNGVYDDGEKILEAQQIRVSRSGVRERTNVGEMRLNNLPAYVRVGAAITEHTVRNPFYIPTVDNFSFIPEPNRVTTINVPFFVAGIIDGSVIRQSADGSQLEPVAGLRIHIKGVSDTTYSKMLLTFSDGSFNFLGLPPGDYIATVDRQHLDLLKAKSVPAFMKFTVQPTQNGDYIQGINFELTDPEARENMAPMGPPAGPPED